MSTFIQSKLKLPGDTAGPEEERLARRFYFDLRKGQDFIRDDEGVEASDLEQATIEAQAVVDEMRDSNELSSLGKGWSLVIRDKDGATLKTLPLD
jgi:hypothetical protein